MRRSASSGGRPLPARVAARHLSPLLLATGVPVLARPAAADDPAARDAQNGAAPQERELGGPEGVDESLSRQTARESDYAFSNFQRWAAPYYDWKARMKEEAGLELGLSTHFLFQDATSSTTGEDDAFGWIFRFHGSWTALGRETGHPGRLEWRVEHRSALGGFQAPTTLGGAAGAAALNSGFAYSEEFDWDVPVLNWTQAFNDRRGGVAVGRLAFDVYLDAFRFQTFSRGFLNRAFLLNPTMGTTGIGALGAVAKSFVGDNVWVGGQLHDANAQSGDFDFDTVQENEWLTALEVGWTPSIDRYKTDRVQLTYWHKDAREKAGASTGQGWVVSASTELSKGLIPFTRFGHSDGGAGVAAEWAASVGLEKAVTAHQTWSLGAGWARPSEETFGPDTRDEYAFETSYNFQLSPNLSLMPDVQLLLEPSNAPDQSSVWIFGVRALMTF